MKDFLYNLTLLFIGLRIAGIIDWNWFLVLSPVLARHLFGLFMYTKIALSTDTDGEEEDD